MTKKQTKKSVVTSLLDSIDRKVKSSVVSLEVGQPKGRLMTKVVQFESCVLRVYSIGYLAVALDRSTATIRRWQRMKLIQPPIVKTKDGARWYLKEEIEMYSRLVRTYDLMTGVSIEKTAFPKAVKDELVQLRDNVTRTIKAKAG